MKLTDKSRHRTDQIRRRRLSDRSSSSPAAKKSKKRVIAPQPPPVLVRTPIAGISHPVSRGTKKSRRFYHLSLNPAYGSEMRLPAFPAIPISWRLVSLILFASVGAILYFLWESPSFHVDAPKIEGLKRLTANQLNNELGLIGVPIFALDSTKLENDLLAAFPEFSEAMVVIGLPNSVAISVTERTPVLNWVSNGENFLVDAQGITFPTRGINESGSYPVVEATGESPEVNLSETPSQALKDETIKKITGILLPSIPAQEQVRPLISPEMVRSILLVAEQSPDGAKLSFDPIHGIGWTDRRGWNVYLGEAQEIDVKVQIYKAIMERLKKDEIRPSMISVEYTHAPYYRLEE